MNTLGERGAPTGLPNSPRVSWRFRMLKKITDFARQDDGVTAVEYAVLAVLIIAAVVLAMTAFSGSLTTAFSAIGTKLTGATLGS